MNDPVGTAASANPPAAHGLKITVEEREPDAVVVGVTGELDMLTARMLGDALRPVLNRAGRTVVIDLSGVGFLGSAGLSELVAAQHTATRNGTAMRLAGGDGPAVRRPLEVTGLMRVFELYDSVDAALGAAADQV
jgi:anti-sigma B factor antagonist